MLVNCSELNTCPFLKVNYIYLAMIDTAVSHNNTLECQSDRNVWLETGSELANSGNYVEALEQLDLAVAFQLDNNAAWVMRAVVLIHLQRYAEALTCCDRALAIDNSDRQAWLFRGAALNYLGRYQDCYASYDKVLGVERRTIGQRISQFVSSFFKADNSACQANNAVSVSSQA